MALISGIVNVTDVAVRVDVECATGRDWNAIVRNSGSTTVYIGSNTVTTTTGFPIYPDGEYELKLGERDRGLYAITTTTGSLVKIGTAVTR